MSPNPNSLQGLGKHGNYSTLTSQGYKFERGVFVAKKRSPLLKQADKSLGVNPPSFSGFMVNSEIPSATFLSTGGKSVHSVPGMQPKKSTKSNLLMSKRNPMLNTASDVFTKTNELADSLGQKSLLHNDSLTVSELK